MSQDQKKNKSRDGLRLKQQTLKNQINCSGTGLHSGAQVSLSLLPAEPDTGIVFRRTDVRGASDLPASWQNVVDSQLCTALGDGNGMRIGTVEHLMAALAGCGVDVSIVEPGGFNTGIGERLTVAEDEACTKSYGEVVQVSADAFSDETTRERFYLVDVKIDRGHLNEVAPDLELTAGMPADVFITTKQRTVAQYLIQPVMRSFERAFREG